MRLSMNSFLISFLLLGTAKQSAVAGYAGEGESTWGSIAGKLMQSGRFWNYLGYSFLAGEPHHVAELLNLQASGITLLAPTDVAFQQIDPRLLVCVRSNHTALRRLLETHILSSRIPASVLKIDEVGKTYGTLVEDVSLQKFRSNVAGKVQLGPLGTNATGKVVTVIQSNLYWNHRVYIHVVNKVIIPPDIDALVVNEHMDA